MIPQFTEFDSIPLNGTSDEFQVWVPDEAQTPTTVTIQALEQPFRDPIYQSYTPQMRRIPFVVFRGGGAPADVRQFGADVRKLFNPKSGPRILRGLHIATQVQQSVLIESIDLRPKHLDVYEGAFLLPGDTWLGNTAGPDDTSPVVVGGTDEALPAISFAAATVAITSNSVANPTVVTAPSHGFATGQRVLIENVVGGTPSINGEYAITNTGVNTFTIPVNATVGGTGGTAKAIIRRGRLTATDQTGRGLDSYLIKTTLDMSNSGVVDASDIEVFVNGHSVLFNADLTSLSAVNLFYRITTPVFGVATIDVYFGRGVNNTVTANQLDDGGLDLTNANFSNTRWIWRTASTTLFGKLVFSMFDISRNPRVAGAWSLARLGRTYPGLNWGFTPGATARFDVGPADGFGSGLNNDYDGLILFTQVEAITTNALQGISAVLTSAGGTISPVIAVEYLRANDLLWQTAGNGFASGGWDIDDAIAVRIYLKAQHATSQGTLTVDAYATDPPPEIHLQSGKVPVISAVTYTAAQVMSGTLTNTTTGDAIQFVNVYWDNAATLLFDCSTGDLTVSSGPGPYGQILPTNPKKYFPLEVGSNNFTNPTGFKATFSWNERYVGL